MPAKCLTTLRVAGAMVLASLPLQAQVVLPKLFTDHMVLQRDAPVHVWGWARQGQTVTVGFRGKSESGTADSAGRWDVNLPPGPAGGPFTLQVRGPSNEIGLSDILVGDVWVASGQSNMEMPVAGWVAGEAGIGKAAPMNNSAREIAAANHPQIRLLKLEKQQSLYPMDDVLTAKGWQVCSPESAGPFAATAYFFARDLQPAIKVPVGVIQSTWGGTQGASWTSMQALTSEAGLLPLLANFDARFRDHATALRQADMEKLSGPAEQKPGKPRVGKGPEWCRPGGLFNGMIAPLAPLRIKGFLWYQGESDSAVLDGRLYGRLLPALIADWRRAWQQENLPFLYVQIAGHQAVSRGWPAVREGMRRTLTVPNTGMAVAADIGDKLNVHPSNKQDVGLRLSLVARALVYGQQVGHSGPAYRKTTREGSRLRVSFDHAEGMTAKGGVLKGFEIAGADHHFVPATAEIQGDSIFVSNPQIPAPAYVRYAWLSYPEMTLYNAADLPASPFTSEESY